MTDPPAEFPKKIRLARSAGVRRRFGQFFFEFSMVGQAKLYSVTLFFLRRSIVFGEPSAGHSRKKSFFFFRDPLGSVGQTSTFPLASLVWFFVEMPSRALLVTKVLGFCLMVSCLVVLASNWVRENSLPRASVPSLLALGVITEETTESDVMWAALDVELYALESIRAFAFALVASLFLGDLCK